MGLGLLPQSIKVLQWMVHGINLQIFMQSPGVLEINHVIFSNILWGYKTQYTRQPVQESY